MMSGVFHRSRILRESVSPSIPGSIRSTSRMSNFCDARSWSACPPSWASAASTPFWPRNSTSSAASFRSSSINSARIISDSLLPSESALVLVPLLHLVGQLLALGRRERIVHLHDLRHDHLRQVLDVLRPRIGEVVEGALVHLVAGERRHQLLVRLRVVLVTRLHGAHDLVLRLLDHLALLRRRLDVILHLLDVRRDHVVPDVPARRVGGSSAGESKGSCPDQQFGHHVVPPGD